MDADLNQDMVADFFDLSILDDLFAQAPGASCCVDGSIVEVAIEEQASDELAAFAATVAAPQQADMALFL